MTTIERSVDLKWSAWSADESTWKEYAGAAILAEMRAAFSGECRPVAISSSTNKDCRHGFVSISKGVAEGYFVTTWDEIDISAETPGVTDDDDDREALAEAIPFSQISMELDMDRKFSIEAALFEEMLTRVDAEEAALIAEYAEAWQEIESSYKAV